MISNEQFAVIDAAVHGYLNGIPDVALRNAVTTVAEDYLHDIGGIPFVRCAACTDGAIVVSAPDGGTVVSVDEVFVGGERIDVGSWIASSVVGGRMAVALSVPTGGRDVSVRARWMPTYRTEELPQDFFDAHAKAVKDGVLAFLLSQTNRPWGDAATAAHFIVEFDKDKYDARSRRLSFGEPGNRHPAFDTAESWI